MKSVPKESADLCYTRIIDFLEKYHSDALRESKFPNANFKNTFNLKSLCLSCYAQGLLDAQQLPK